MSLPMDVAYSGLLLDCTDSDFSWIALIQISAGSH